MTDVKLAKLRAGIYIRVSSKRQVEEGFSLDSQRASSEGFGASKGWSTCLFEDAGVSGAKKSRPALDELVAAIEAGEIDVLISPWMDRIGRSAANTAALYEIFDNAGIALWTPDGKKYDGDGAAAKLMRNALAMAAQFERDMISERVTASNPGKAQRGSFHGGAIPFGYELGEKGGLVICESDAKWLRLMFKRYAYDNATQYAIAQEFNREGVRNQRGGKWRGNAIATRLRNDIYIGKVSGGHAGKHEPLIDLKTWNAVQTRLAATSRLPGNGRGKYAANHLLDHGMLKCSCGSTMKPSNHGERERMTYTCRGMTQGFGCPDKQGALPQEAIDKAMLDYLSEHVISSGMTVSELESERARAVTDAKQTQAAAARARNQTEARRESAEEKWLDDKITDKRWAELQEKFFRELAAAEGEQTAAEATISALEQPDPEALAAVERLRADIAVAAEDGSMKRYSALVKRLYERVELVRGAQVQAGPPTAIEAAQAAEYDDEPTICFEHKGRAYALVPILRPELAALYGCDPMVGAAAQVRASASSDAPSIAPSGTPNSGKMVSVERKNVSSTILPSATSSTCSAHGS
jgi:DNA invertase Pin-like site-specific DNA recombinase